ncbi:hypothetical protein AB8Q18_08550 [Neisseriaceae bacterium CLB008]
MKYFSNINNEKCLEWGLNLTQGALMDLLSQLPGWAEESFIDGKVYYWASRNEVIKELPVAYSKPDTVYRHMMDLKKLGLIDHIKLGQKDMVAITQKGKEWSFRDSEINPSDGNKSEETRKNIRENSEINPTYKNTNPDTRKDIENKQKKSAKQTKHEAALAILAEHGVTDQLAEDYITVRGNKTLTVTAMQGVVREASKAGLSVEQAVTVSVERGWVGFKHDWLLNAQAAKQAPTYRVADQRPAVVPPDAPKAQAAGPELGEGAKQLLAAQAAARDGSGGGLGGSAPMRLGDVLKGALAGGRS